jgi:two-component system, sensor histidine kinase RpfC
MSVQPTRPDADEPVQSLSDARPGPLWRRLADRLRDRGDSEHEQVLVRIGFAIGIFGSLWLVALSGRMPETIGTCLLIAAWYLVCATALLGHLLWRPAVSPGRRYAGMLLDLTTLPIGMIVGGAVVAPLYPMFLWITFGMGFRYGQRYLLAAALASLAGFALVIALTEYWRAQPALSAALWVALLVLPAYASSLLSRLTDALARAEEASQAKSRFLATMSHELRTPLHATIGMADLLRATRLDAEQRDMVRTIRSAGQTLLDMIGEVLHVARTGSEQPAPMVDFDLHALLASVRALLQREAAERGLALQLEIDPGVPYLLHGASRALQQILTNLTANAIKFTPQGSVTVRATGEAADDELVRLRFEVVDTGIGIPLEAQERIFERFTQADQSITRRYGGTGLGLAIARQLTEALGGALTVRSAPGQGSCFILRAAFAPLPEATPRLRGLVVLAGPPRAAAAYRQRLAPWGCELAVAANADVAHALLGQAGRRRAVLLLDQAGRGPHWRLGSELAARFASEPVNVVAIGEGALTVRGHCLAVLPPAADDRRLHASLHAALAVPEGLVDAKAVATRDWPSRRILVAEDNRVNQQVIQRMLTSVGHRVTLVANGEEALDALAEGEFDLVLLDLNMPLIGGLDTVKLHRFGSGGHDDPPFVALTADATDETRRQCEEAGFEAYLTKPVDLEDLIFLVDRLTLHATRPSEPGRIAGPGVPGARVDPPPALDRSCLERLQQLDQDDDFLRQIVNDFLADAGQLVTELEDAAASGDAAIFRDRAHALRSSAAHVGAVALFDLCLGWRGIGADELAGQGARHAARLRSEFARLETALLEELAAPRSPEGESAQQATLTGAGAGPDASRARRRS